MKRQNDIPKLAGTARNTPRRARLTLTFSSILRGIWFAVLLHFSSSLPAADSPFTVDAWTTDDGLPQSSVLSIVQTHDGYLWLGTLNGLVRFDGHSFTCFNVNNTSNLPADRIVFLFEDSQHVLWAGTDNAGLCRHY